MNLKLMLAAVAVVGSAAANAEVKTGEAEGSNVFGAIRVTSDFKEVIIATPWVGSKIGDETGVAVSNYVDTANLTAGDELFAYGATTADVFDSWKLTEVGEAGKKIKQWSKVTEVSEDRFQSSTEPDKVAIKRGNGLILRRNTLSDDKSFCIVGQVTTNDTVTMTLPGGKNSFVAPPTTDAKGTFVNADAAAAGDCILVWDAPGRSDVILVPAGDGGAYTTLLRGPKLKTKNAPYNTYSQWGVSGTGGNFDISAKIPCGQGAWYKNNGSSDVTVTWKKKPAEEVE